MIQTNDNHGVLKALILYIGKYMPRSCLSGTERKVAQRFKKEIVS